MAVPAAVSLLATVWAACGRGAEDYRVTVDLGPAIRALGSDDLEESERATDRILALAADALPALERALATEPAPVRRGVVESLGRIDDPRAAAMLVRAAAGDADVEVRYEALTATGRLDAPAGRAVVEAALDDPEPRVRLAAVGACAALCTSPAAMATLVRIATAGRPLAAATAARTALVRLLGADTERAERARAAIRGGVPEVLAGRRDGDGVVLAALLASDVGDAGGRAVLARAARGAATGLLRLQAIHALGAVGGSDDVAVLAALDGDATGGDYAYDALRRLAARGVDGAQRALDGWRGPRPAALPPPPGAH